MATVSILHLSRGMSLSRVFGSHLLPRASQVGASTAVKPFTTAALCKQRVYGPQTDSEKVDEVHHWTNERYVALALIPIIPTALAFPNIVLDTALTTGIILHCHWRFTGVTHDYIHGSILPVIAKYTVLALSIGAFGSLCYFNYYDVGFANAARMIFSQL